MVQGARRTVMLASGPAPRQRNAGGVGAPAGPGLPAAREDR